MAIPRILARNGWSPWHLVSGIAMVGVGFAITADAWRDIWQLIQRRPSAAHIVLVPFVFLWLVWVRRKRVRFCQPVGTWVGPVLVAIGWLISSWGAGHGIKVPWHCGALLFVIGCFLSVFGIEVFRQFLAAFVALIFLIPPPISIAVPMLQPLQTATADVTQSVYAAFGMPIEQIGGVVQIGQTRVPMSSAFGVLGVLFAFIVMGYTVAFGAPLRFSARALILIASVLVGFLVNVCRALATAWLYAYYQPQRVEQIMAITGWVMLLVAFLALLGVVKALLWASIPVRRYTLVHGA